MPAAVAFYRPCFAAAPGFCHITSIFLAALGASCFLSFVWAFRSHFKRQGRTPKEMRRLSLLSLAGFLWFIADCATSKGDTGRSHFYEVDLAVLLFVSALIVFWWAVRVTRNQPLTLAFTSDVPAFLQRRGPFNYVRHPFYLSYLLFWIGAALVAHHWLYWLVPAVMGALYFDAARREERKFDASALAASYRAYRQRTGMLLPRFWRQSGEAG